MTYCYSIEGEAEPFYGRFRTREAALRVGRKAARADGTSSGWVWTARRCTREEAKEFPPPAEAGFVFWTTDTQEHPP